MMRLPSVILAVAAGFLATLGACEHDANSAAPGGAGLGASPSGATPAGLLEVRAAVDQVSTTMRGITDAPSAERAKAELTRRVDDLQRQVASAGDLPHWLRELDGEAGDLRGALQAQVGKLAAKPEVAKALGPVLDRLRKLAYGAGATGATPFIYTIF